jgi:hypothetical protein
METTDLMIGDWVFYKNFKGNLVPHKIICISETFAEFEDPPYNLYKYERMYPIPLTPEILEKNGFVISSEHANLYFSEGDEKMSFCLRKMYDKLNNFVFYGSICYNIVSPIKYVHELQHALKLCKIDKEIVL